jgi:hypothetical protein
MATFILAAYLLLVGLTLLVNTSIPTWVVGVAAVLTALALIYEKVGLKSAPPK